MRKYPTAVVVSFQQENALFLYFSYGLSPAFRGDAVSIYLNAVRLHFAKYLLRSFLATFPGIITATLIETSITDPSSTIFWISVLLTITISVVLF